MLSSLFGEISRPIRQVEIGDYYISTVYIPDLTIFGPVCYETMVCHKGDWIFQDRRETEEVAVLVNEALCAIAKKFTDEGIEAESIELDEESFEEMERILKAKRIENKEDL